MLQVISRSTLWEELIKSYVTFMVADDDILMSTHVINTSFQIFVHYNLQLGQPAVCDHRDSTSLQPLVIRRRGSALRYTSFVEIMTPMFSREVMQNVVLPNLNDSYTGYGLDLGWPKSLGYPRTGIAIIDAVCVFHPAFQSPNRTTVYSFHHPRGWRSMDENREMLRRFNVSKAGLREAGVVGRQERHVWSSVSMAELHASFQPWLCGPHTCPEWGRRSWQAATYGCAGVSLVNMPAVLAVQVALVAVVWVVARRWRRGPAPPHLPKPMLV